MSATTAPYFDVESEVKRTLKGLNVQMGELEALGMADGLFGGLDLDQGNNREEFLSAWPEQGWNLSGPRGSALAGRRALKRPLRPLPGQQD